MKSILHNNQIIEHKDISYSTIDLFFESYDKSIGLVDDKDTKEDFVQIMSSSDEVAEFGVAYIKERDEIISGVSYVKINIPSGYSEKWKMNSIIVIIYTFTLNKYRLKGLNKRLITSLEEFFGDKCLWFCEVLDIEKMSKEQIQLENKFSDLNCINREMFWRKMGFKKCSIDYYVPIPKLQDHCNGKIGYNSLWVKTNKHNIASDIIKFFLYNYFKYGYCAGDIEYHKWEAYDLLCKSMNKSFIFCL